MKNLLVVDTTWPMNTRTERFTNTFKSKFNCIVCAWNRGRGGKTYPEESYILETNTGYGNPLRKLLILPLFLLHIIKVYKKCRPDVILASHWDSLFLVLLAKVIVRGDALIVYDCLDLPTSKNKIILKFLHWLERKMLKSVDLTIYASRFFGQLYDGNNASITFENYPPKTLCDKNIEPPSWFQSVLDFDSNTLNLSWIGVVRYPEVLMSLLKFIKQTSRYRLLVFGDGPSLKYMQGLVGDMCICDKVFFFGRYNNNQLKYIYDVSDLVWAAYPTNDYNTRYAISNKYFECSLFSTVPIISAGTMMSKHREIDSSIIFVDESSVDDIFEKLERYDFGKKFKKYEIELFWECQEYKLFEAFNDMSLKKEKFNVS